MLHDASSASSVGVDLVEQAPQAIDAVLFNLPWRKLRFIIKLIYKCMKVLSAICSSV